MFHFFCVSLVDTSSLKSIKHRTYFLFSWAFMHCNVSGHNLGTDTLSKDHTVNAIYVNRGKNDTLFKH